MRNSLEPEQGRLNALRGEQCYRPFREPWPLTGITHIRREKDPERLQIPSSPLPAFLTVQRFKPFQIDAVWNDPHFSAVNRPGQGSLEVFRLHDNPFRPPRGSPRTPDSKPRDNLSFPAR